MKKILLLTLLVILLVFSQGCFPDKTGDAVSSGIQEAENDQTSEFDPLSDCGNGILENLEECEAEDWHCPREYQEGDEVQVSRNGECNRDTCICEPDPYLEVPVPEEPQPPTYTFPRGGETCEGLDPVTPVMPQLTCSASDDCPPGKTCQSAGSYCKCVGKTKSEPTPQELEDYNRRRELIESGLPAREGEVDPLPENDFDHSEDSGQFASTEEYEQYLETMN